MYSGSDLANRILSNMQYDGGIFPDGASCGETARRLRQRLSNEIPAPVAEALEICRREFGARAAPPPKARRSTGAIRGVYGAYPVYSLFEPMPGGPNVASYVVRVIVLLVIMGGGDSTNPYGQNSHIAILARLARAFARNKHQQLAAEIEQAVHQELVPGDFTAVRQILRTYLASESDRPLKVLADACEASNGFLSRFLDFAAFEPPFELWEAGAGFETSARVEYEPSSGPPDTELLSDGLAPGDCVELLPVVTVQASDALDLDIKRAVATVAHSLRVARPFSIHSGAALTVPEANRFVDHACTIASGHPDHVQRCAAAIAILHLVTVQRASSLMQLLWASHPGVPGTLTRTGEISLAVPHHADFAKVSPDIDRYGAVGVVALVLPTLIVKILDGLQGHSQIFPFAAEELSGALKGFYREMRLHVSRATADRCANTLPCLLYDESKDTRDVQLICGSALSLSPNPIFYYSARNDVLSKLHAKCVDTLMGPHAGSRSADHSESIVGSRLGAADHVASTIIKALDDDLGRVTPQGRRAGRPRLKDWYLRMNAFSRRCAWMWASAVGFRNTNEIGAITMQDISVDGLYPASLVNDKKDRASDGGVQGYRASSLGKKLLPAQLKEFLRLLSRFCEQSFEDEAALECQYEAGKALAGLGPCFLELTEAGAVRPGSRRWLIEGMGRPDIPVNIFRHILSTRWVACGGSARDRYLQLGHAEFGCHAFGGDSADSPEQFLRRAAPVVEQFMLELGWTVVRCDRAWEVPQLSGELRGWRQRAVAKERNERAAMRSKRRMATLEREIRSIVVDMLSESVDSPPTVEAIIKRLPQARVGDDVRALVREIYEEALDAGAIRSGPYRLALDSQERAFLSPARFLAWRDLLSLREWREDKLRSETLDQLRDNKSYEVALVSVALELLLWHPVRDLEHLLACMRGLSSGRLQQSFPSCLRIRTVVGTEDQSDWLSPVLAARLSRYQSHFDALSERLLLGDLKTALESELAAWTIPSYSKGNRCGWLFNLLHSAGSFEWPGHLWALIAAARDESPLSADRAEDWSIGKKGQGSAQAREDRLDGAGLPAQPPDLHSAALSGDWITQLNSVREALSIAAPNSKSGRAGARAALLRVLEGQGSDPSSSLGAEIIARFALTLLKPGAKAYASGRLAASTISSYVSIAIRAVRSATPEMLQSGCLESAYLAVLGDKGQEGSSFVRAKVSALRRLDALMASHYGFEEVDGTFWLQYHSRDVVRAEIVTAGEISATRNILCQWEEEAAQEIGADAARLVRGARVAFEIHTAFGTRPREAIELEIGDVLTDGGVPYGIVIRSNSLRSTKSGVRQKLLILEDAPDGVRQWLTTYLSDQCKALVDRQRSLPLLLAPNRPRVESGIIARVINRALREATSDHEALQYALRHTFACRKFDELMVSRSPYQEGLIAGDVYDLSQRMPHSSDSLVLASYIHISRLASGHLGGIGALTRQSVALVSGRSLPARRRWATRLPIPPAPGEDEPALIAQIRVINEACYAHDQEIQPEVPSGAEFPIDLLDQQVTIASVAEVLLDTRRRNDLSVLEQLLVRADATVESIADVMRSALARSSSLRRGGWLRRADLRRSAVDVVLESLRRAYGQSQLGAEMLKVGQEISGPFRRDLYPPAHAPHPRLRSRREVELLGGLLATVVRFALPNHVAVLRAPDGRNGGVFEMPPETPPQFAVEVGPWSAYLRKRRSDTVSNIATHTVLLVGAVYASVQQAP